MPALPIAGWLHVPQSGAKKGWLLDEAGNRFQGVGGNVTNPDGGMGSVKQAISGQAVVDSCVAAGYDLVRLPVYWQQWETTKPTRRVDTGHVGELTHTWASGKQSGLLDTIDKFTAKGIRVIVDAHMTDASSAYTTWLWDAQPGLSDTQKNSAFFQNRATSGIGNKPDGTPWGANDLWIEFVVKLATLCVSRDCMVGIDVLNEPPTTSLINSFGSDTKPTAGVPNANWYSGATNLAPDNVGYYSFLDRAAVAMWAANDRLIFAYENHLMSREYSNPSNPPIFAQASDLRVPTPPTAGRGGVMFSAHTYPEQVMGTINRSKANTNFAYLKRNWQMAKDRGIAFWIGEWSLIAEMSLNREGMLYHETVPSADDLLLRAASTNDPTVAGLGWLGWIKREWITSTVWAHQSGSGTCTLNAGPYTVAVKTGTPPAKGFTDAADYNARIADKPKTAANCIAPIAEYLDAMRATGGGGTVDVTPPSVPGGFVGSGLPGPTQMALTWTPSTDETGGSGLAGYRVYQGATSSAAVLIASPTSTSYVVTGLTPASPYRFWVSSIDNAGNESAKAGPLDVTTASTTVLVAGWVTVTPREQPAGFYPGVLWRLFEATSDPAWRTAARAQLAAIRSSAVGDGTLGDLGMIVLPSLVLGSVLDPANADAFRNDALAGAASYASRYDATVGMVEGGFGARTADDFRVTIDQAAQVELLLWSAENGGPSTHRDIAVSHVDRTLRDLVRSNGSTYHVANYSRASGALVDFSQGYASSVSSTWARGAAYGLLGFAAAARYLTGSVGYAGKAALYLDAAKRIANFAAAGLPTGSTAPGPWVPYWDFVFTEPSTEPRDSAAAAILACGLIDLSDQMHVTEPARSAVYFGFAWSILNALNLSAYRAATGATPRSQLLHGTERRSPALGVDTGTIAGDYFALTARKRWLAGSATL